MMAALESGDPDAVCHEDFFPELAAHLKEEIAQFKAQGIAMEYRNLCVRKVELILVRNFAEKSQDEFIARVRAHSQKVLRRGGVVGSQDEDVVPFEQFVAMGRLGDRWKLKEVLLHRGRAGGLKAENLDRRFQPRTVKWYYQHNREV